MAILNIPNCLKVNIYENFIVTDIYDNDRTGTIDIREFQQLFQSINQWKGTFESFDRDRSGRIEKNELEQGESSSSDGPGFQKYGFGFRKWPFLCNGLNVS